MPTKPPLKPGQCWRINYSQEIVEGVLAVGPEYPAARLLNPGMLPDEPLPATIMVWRFLGVQLSIDQAHSLLTDNPRAVCVFNPWESRRDD